MKKQVSKITLKTDKIISLSKNDAQRIQGGLTPATSGVCTSLSSKIICITK